MVNRRWHYNLLGQAFAEVQADSHRLCYAVFGPCVSWCLCLHLRARLIRLKLLQSRQVSKRATCFGQDNQHSVVPYKARLERQQVSAAQDQCCARLHWRSAPMLQRRLLLGGIGSCCSLIHLISSSKRIVPGSTAAYPSTVVHGVRRFQLRQLWLITSCSCRVQSLLLRCMIGSTKQQRSVAFASSVTGGDKTQREF
jgi:hypothetical protein